MDNKIPKCEDFQEYPDWKKNPNKKIGVTWTAWCSECGFKLENKPFGNELTIEGNGRVLGRITNFVIIDNEIFRSDKFRIACSNCFPCLKK